MAKAIKEPVVAREVAEEDFARMCEAFFIKDLTPDPEPPKPAAQDGLGGDDDEPFVPAAPQPLTAEMISAAQFKYRKGEVVDAIMAGRLTVDNETGQPTYQTAKGKALTFRQPTGATFIAFEKATGTHAQLAIAATDMTQTNKGFISTLNRPDFRLVEVLSALFLDM